MSQRNGLQSNLPFVPAKSISGSVGWEGEYDKDPASRLIFFLNQRRVPATVTSPGSNLFV